ncbi:hypothetical protein KIN20_002231 [Parelaphostrongylus tenuis]|uniref:Uncharacterized protein n=1 Tax=Parelaphostrongylus tenuis TaxID=148309 RepID=A0AAD5LUV8_PARTN|nr:hypothetical protein KIN20_002231 [Parelaphostrongylus tenuis]
MVELVVGDLYDLAANTQNGVRIHPEAVYECRYCPMFQISGSSLCDSDKGRGHAAAHRIAFEALLQPSPILICPICESPQKTSDTACIFGCMFNDLDLVEHLEKDHSDILADDTVCDFSDSRYLLTTFQEKELPRTILESSGEAADVVDSGVDDGTIIDHATLVPINSYTISQRLQSDDDKDAELNSPGVDDRKSSQTDNSATDKFRGNVEAIHVSMVSGDEGGVTHENHADAVRNSKRTSRKKRCKRPRPRGQMRGVSVVTCLPCQWSPSAVSDPMRMRDEISKHVRFHIREESARHPSKSSSFSADQRILSTMDSSLEEYFGKEHLTDLSGIINSQVMESVYGELLAKLFGICVPLVYRILHGNNGNPFRSPEASRRKRNARFTRPKINKGSLKAIPLGRAGRNSERNGPVSAELTEGSDADCSVEECADLLVAGNFESDQHIQCARAECGHSLLALADRMAIVRHIAAHIRHDEARLLNKNGAYAAVACECGMAVGSAIGYIYHIAHDHVFEHKKFSDICATIVSYITLVVDSAIESVLPVCVDFRATKWPLWYAYFSLENDEGDEKFFSDSTDLNEHWLKLWEDLVDEHTTGRSISPGDRIKLFKMHPFVDGERPLSRKRKSLPLMDSEAFYRSLSLVWRRLDSWAYDPVHRTQLASESRWIRLAQIRRKAFLEANKDEYEYSDIFSGLAADPKLDIEGGPHLLDWSSVTQDVTHTDDVAANEIVPVSSENSSLSAVSPVNVLALAIEQCANSPSSDLIVNPSSTSGSSYQEPGGAAELSGTVVRCSNCSNVCINSLDTAAIKNHCALHAVMEGRMLCSLYIHRGADRPQICPFCHSEVNLYKPGGFLHHLQSRHMHKARIIYDRYLFPPFSAAKIFSDPFVPSGRPRGGSLTKSRFIAS